MQIHRLSTHNLFLESIPVPVRTLEGHANWVTALAVLSDGTLVSGSQDKTIKLWNKNGHCMRTLEGHTGSIYALAVLPDGTLVSGSQDNTIKLWDRNGHCVRTLEGHTNWVTALAVLPDGTLVSGSEDKTIKRWNKNGRCARALEGHAYGVRALAVLLGGTLVSGSDDKTIKLWDKNGYCVRTLQGHTDWVRALAVLPDGTLVSGSDDKIIKLWDKKGRCVRTLEGHTNVVMALAALPDGTLVSGSHDKTIKLWDKNGRCVHTLQGHTNSVLALAVLPDGIVASGSWDETIKLWEVQALRLGMAPAHSATSMERLIPEDIQALASPAVRASVPVFHPVPAAAEPASAPVVVTVSPPSRPVPPLVMQVHDLLEESRALSLSPREQKELANIDAYHQHFYNAPLTDEARHELTRQVTRLNELIDRKTPAPAAALPAQCLGDRATEEKHPSSPKPSGMLDSQGRIQLNISIPYEKLQYQEVLGEGSFGVVYRGRWDGHTDVAIKELKHKQLSINRLEDFKLEATHMARLRHPTIVGLYGVCLKPKHYSLVMEYLPNVSLYQLLNNGQPLPWSVRHQIVMDVTQGMTYLHANQMVHCDLKSLNVLLDDHLRAKIADFGLAKLKTETASIITKGAGRSRGSVPWMAPELFDDKGKNTKASDVYAYGMVLWEIASRKLPFAGAANLNVMIAWIMKEKKETIPDECPAELKTLMEDCWKVAEQRPSMSATLARLERWQASQETAAAADQLNYTFNQQSFSP